ncbi:hypothetical protein TRFO_23396 [Tritrichomonas foetus]|uniref:Uncharacterized protein n=1 Tax=Tritrichomonas foetus TaxID=1144522 RepID=A0A1J4KF17_9EUKA|nr:hypothetical protein TRFO_23396 [Tritrichomonas foetus]|eukprot:OHT08182.1 hypothetical protein TRFO_23396 [Tritrichomonas foetus]
MDEAPKADDKGLTMLKSAIQAKEDIIQKQQAQIQVLQESLLSNQQTIRKLESTLANQNQRTMSLQQKNQILQTNCDHLETRLQFKRQTHDQAGSELQNKLADLSKAQSDQMNLQSRITIAQNEIKTAEEKESGLLAKVSELSNQKRQLELENNELKQYQSLAEEMQSQLELARLQIQQLETIHTKTQESIGVRDNELVKLRNENEALVSKYNKIRSLNKQFEKEVSQLNNKMQAISITTEQIDEIQAKIASKDQEIANYKEKNKKLTSQIKKLKEKQNDKTYKSQIKKLQSKLKEKEKELAQNQELLKEIQEQNQNNMNNLRNLNNNLNQENFFSKVNAKNNKSQILQQMQMQQMPQQYFSPENLVPKELYDKLKMKYKKLKKAKAVSLEEIYTLKLAAVRLEDDLSMYENVISSLREEREDLKSKLFSAENYISQLSKRNNNIDNDDDLIRDHLNNVNQDELTALQVENNNLRKRMDDLEQGMMIYNEKQRRNPVKTTVRPRKTVFNH